MLGRVPGGWGRTLLRPHSDPWSPAPPGKMLKQIERQPVQNRAASSGTAAKKGNRIYFKSKDKALRFISASWLMAN